MVGQDHFSTPRWLVAEGTLAAARGTHRGRAVSSGGAGSGPPELGPPPRTAALGRCCASVGMAQMQKSA